ncbi:MAG: hypothetical protein KF882_09775 [Bacteroidia bacterium]|nr:hypothetical protein [Bacteroidia bacterium]MCO5253545.1 hypothetical protein [Bacteroidota bacterium]
MKTQICVLIYVLGFNMVSCVEKVKHVSEESKIVVPDYCSLYVSRFTPTDTLIMFNDKLKIIEMSDTVRHSYFANLFIALDSNWNYISIFSANMLYFDSDISELYYKNDFDITLFGGSENIRFSFATREIEKIINYLNLPTNESIKLSKDILFSYMRGHNEVMRNYSEIKLIDSISTLEYYLDEYLNATCEYVIEENYHDVVYTKNYAQWVSYLKAEVVKNNTILIYFKDSIYVLKFINYDSSYFDDKKKYYGIDNKDINYHLIDVVEFKACQIISR